MVLKGIRTIGFDSCLHLVDIPSSPSRIGGLAAVRYLGTSSPPARPGGQLLEIFDDAATFPVADIVPDGETLGLLYMMSLVSEST